MMKETNDIKILLTIVKRPPTSTLRSIGKVNSRKSSKRLRKADTESSNLPRPNCSFEQSNNIIGGF